MSAQAALSPSETLSDSLHLPARADTTKTLSASACRPARFCPSQRFEKIAIFTSLAASVDGPGMSSQLWQRTNSYWLPGSLTIQSRGKIPLRGFFPGELHIEVQFLELRWGQVP